ncbi:transaldolase family protein [Quadrisphaera sp. INWT6]|uniref:transaldolase family protein n=1 Tax=Quadrisphaera sp. INWT6 TaxID=2596917 RepID=UPI0018921F71|nr:transaldolase family protein [Quadrisphaera sp. INWT6]MBF5083191.1 transaldolase [Quadrisphaera sp. INWT6]
MTTTAPAPAGTDAATGTQASETELPTALAARTTPTALWNDSAEIGELTKSIAWGAVGATCNPVIALAAINADEPRWTARLRELAAENPTAGESALGWMVVEELSVEAAKLLEPAFEASGGRNGRLSMQTDPRFHRDAAALADQAERFSKLAKNIIVKIPATKTGIEAMEEAAYRGVSLNATVSFTVPQAIAVAEAIERGMQRREAEGLPMPEFGHVCTIMGGRLDDWMKAYVAKNRLLLDPGHLEWAGVAALKKAHHLFVERGYRVRILSAAFRNSLQWSELQGGDLVVSPPFDWQARINENRIPVNPHAIDEPVASEHLEALSAIPEWHRAYDVDGMTVEEFEDFGATRKTLRQFLEADAQLDAIVRDVLVAP